MFLFSCAHALCLFHLCYAYRTRVNQSLGLGRNGQKIVYFANKSVTSSLRKVLPMIFRSTKVCQGLPNLKQAVVLPRSGAKFRQTWNLTELSIYTPWFWRKMSIMKIWSLWSFGIFQSEARQNYSYLRGNQTVKMEGSYLGVLHDDRYSEYSYYGSQVYAPAHLQGQVLFNLHIPMQIDQIHCTL